LLLQVDFRFSLLVVCFATVPLYFSRPSVVHDPL
jgi:hypothetical protein